METGREFRRQGSATKKVVLSVEFRMNTLPKLVCWITQEVNFVYFRKYVPPFYLYWPPREGGFPCQCFSSPGQIALALLLFVQFSRLTWEEILINLFKVLMPCLFSSCKQGSFNLHILTVSWDAHCAVAVCGGCLLQRGMF